MSITPEGFTMTFYKFTKAPSKRIKALFGLKPDLLGELLLASLPVLIENRRKEQELRPNRQRAIGGGRKRSLKPFQEILITLVYLRHNVSHEVVGELFGVSADVSENTFHEVIPILREVCPSKKWDAEKKWNKKEPSWEPENIDKTIVDTFETPVRRPSLNERQKRLYSGKKRRHTLKTQVATDKDGEILEVEAGYRGPKGDIKIYEESGISGKYPEAEGMGDLAYKSDKHPEISTPHKKPKGGKLTPEQKEENRQFSQKRVRVEHSIRRLKGWRILREDYRLATGLFPLIAVTVTGLVQLSRIVR